MASRGRGEPKSAGIGSVVGGFSRRQHGVSSHLRLPELQGDVYFHHLWQIIQKD
jgi:hypothetical protein